MTLDNNQFELTSQGIDIPDDIKEIILTPTQINMVKKINEAIDKGFDQSFPKDNETDYDFDSDTHQIDCKYYTIEQMNEKKINSIKYFSILHLNIHSLQFHIEELKIALQLINLKFDFICITESKIIKNCPPKIDIKIKGYQDPTGTPTEAEKGGVLIYIKEGIDFKPREDLNIYRSKELESFFIEASIKKETTPS